MLSIDQVNQIKDLCTRKLNSNEVQDLFNLYMEIFQNDFCKTCVDDVKRAKVDLLHYALNQYLLELQIQRHAKPKDKPADAAEW
jgi:hypothetical protein